MTTGGGHVTTSANWIPGLVVDLAAGDGVTTSTWTYANVGRREFKVFGYISPGFVGSTAGAMSTYTGFVQTATTGAFTGTLTTASGTFSCTTYGPTSELHVYTNDRYARVLHNFAGITSGSAAVFALLEQRAS